MSLEHILISFDEYERLKKIEKEFENIQSQHQGQLFWLTGDLNQR